MKKYLITGGAGFIASHFIEQLKLSDSDAEIFVIDNYLPQVHSKMPAKIKDVNYLPLDITSKNSLFGAVRDVEPNYVVHLAAETGTAQSLMDSSLHVATNSLGTAHLLDALSAVNCIPEKILLSSSRAVYGEGYWQSNDTGEIIKGIPRSKERLEKQQWLPTGDSSGSFSPLAHNALETTPEPVNIYGSTKLNQEHLIKSWCSSFGSALTVMRFQNVYGKGQSITNSYTGILNIFAQLALKGESINLYEDGNIIRDFIYVSDVANAMVKSMLKNVEQKVEYYDIGSGVASSLADVAKVFSSITNSPQAHISGLYRLGDVRAAFANINEAKAKLGWTPQVSLEEGISTLLDWIKNEPDADI